MLKLGRYRPQKIQSSHLKKLTNVMKTHRELGKHIGDQSHSSQICSDPLILESLLQKFRHCKHLKIFKHYALCQVRVSLCLLNVQWDTQTTVKHFYLSQHSFNAFLQQKKKITKNNVSECSQTTPVPHEIYLLPEWYPPLF